MLFRSSYWYDALEYVAHLHNVVPTRALGDVTPEEAWSSNKPDVSRLRVFGSCAFVHILDAQRGKLAAKSLVCTFLGHTRNRKAYHLVHRPTRRFLESRDVIFDEGGATPQTSFERVVIEHDDAETSDMEERGVEAVKARTGNTGAGGADAGKAGGVSEIEREEETEDTLTNASKSTAPTLANSHPKRAVRTPVRDDDLHYSVSSYNTRKRTAEKAKVAQVNTPADPCIEFVRGRENPGGRQ